MVKISVIIPAVCMLYWICRIIPRVNTRGKEQEKNSRRTSEMNRTRFESLHALQPNPMTPLPEEILDRFLGIGAANDIDGMDDTLVARGTTLETQIKSLLPNSLISELKSSLVYVLSRAVTGHLPKAEEWMWRTSEPETKGRKKSQGARRKRILSPIPEGLDSLTAALLTVLIIARLARQEIQWLPAIWQYHVETLRRQQLKPILAKLNTSITVGETRALLENAIGSINQEIPSEPVSKDILDGWLPLLATFDDRTALAECKVTDVIHGHSGPTSARDFLIEGIRVRLGEGVARVRTQFSPSSQWSVLTIRADGPTAGILRSEPGGQPKKWTSFESMIDVLRRDVTILSYPPLSKVLGKLSNIETPGRPSAEDVMKATGLKGRAAFYSLNRLSLLIHERFLLSSEAIGLRYRYIFSPIRKPIIQSEGMIERMSLIDSSHASLTVHLEPVDSVGPTEDRLPFKGDLDSAQFTASKQLLSMRIDLFDSETNEWKLAHSQSAPARPERVPHWLYRESSKKKKVKPISLTQKELDMVAALSGFRGSAPTRRWFLKQLGYPSRDAGQVISKLLNNGALRLLYLPAPEYSGLSNGLIIAARFATLRDLNEFLDRSVVIAPFILLRYDPDNLTAIAHIRTPHLSATYIDGVLGDWLDSINAKYLSATMQELRTNYLTVLHRLYRGQNEPWENPWGEN